jgi:ABC-type sugar transport system ATPase subunit
MSTETLPLTMEGVAKSYGAVQALRAVDIHVRRGECAALVGENGAGKSTLMKILAGVEQPDAGRVLLAGRPVAFVGPRQAEDAGICLIHQEIQLVPTLSVADNMYLGREETHAGVIRAAFQEQRAGDVLRRLGLDLDVRQPVRSFGIGEQQLIEIGKGLLKKAELLIMDEPTAALTHQEVERLFSVIRGLTRDGKSVIFISHRLDEIAEIANRVLVLRDGRMVGELPAFAPGREIVRLMVGREIGEFYPRSARSRGGVALEVRRLDAPGVKRIEFDLRYGEILGVGGLVGAGQRELADALYGRAKPEAGEIRLHGKAFAALTPSSAIANGLALVGEDRRREGLNMRASIAANITLPVVHRYDWLGILRTRELSALAEDLMRRFRVKAASPLQAVTELSGGNQQKVVIAKAVVTKPDVLLLLEPTRGVDVGAKHEIYELLDRFVMDGKAILLISSDLPELLGVSDRILVLYRGAISGALDARTATRESLTALATGQAAEASP